MPDTTRRILPMRYIYVVHGALFALFLLLGFMTARAVASQEPFSLDWLGRELRGQRESYAFLLAFGGFTFPLLGWLLGKRHDDYRFHMYTDPLTGLANRRNLEQRLAHELAQCARYGSSLSVLLVDVDHLKHINDTQGHDAGDTALTAVAQRLLGCARASDLVVRYGGDEFVVVAPRTEAREALELAERARRAILRARVGGLPTTQPLSISVGIADVHGTRETPQGILGRADAALYRAKARGRNRIALCRSTAGPRVARPASDSSEHTAQS